MGILRYLLAIAVVITHSGPVFGIKLIPGDLAVELFFVVSGFYMAMVLSGKYASARTFYINRFLRLYPAYLVVLLATLAWMGMAWLHLGHPPQMGGEEVWSQMRPWQVASVVFANATMVGIDLPSLFHFKAGVGFLPFHWPNTDVASDGAVWSGPLRIIGQSWSIGVEIWFYMLAPMLVRWRSIWLVLLVAASLALRLWLNERSGLGYFFAPSQLFFFVGGMLLYRLYHQRRLAELPRRWGYLALALAIGVIAAFPWLGALQYPLTYAIVILAIPLAFSATRSSKLDAVIGNLSYPIYIVHMLAEMVLRNLFHASNGPTLLLVSTLAAALLYLVIERPIDTIRQRRVHPPLRHVE